MRRQVVEQPVTPKASTEEPKYYQHDCGMRMARSKLRELGMKCIKCEKIVTFDDVQVPTMTIAEAAAKTDAAIAKVGGHDPTKPEPDPYQLKPESVAVPAVTGAAPGFVGTELGFGELMKRLEKNGFVIDSITDVAKWNPEQRMHAHSICSAMEKNLNPTIESWLLQLHSTFGAGLAVEKPKAPLEKQTFDPTKLPGTEATTVLRGVIDETSDSITAYWGEEKFTPIRDSYSTFTVGPFYATSVANEGEDPLDVLKRLNDKLVQFAEKERDRKAVSFIAALKGYRESAKEKA